MSSRTSGLLAQARQKEAASMTRELTKSPCPHVSISREPPDPWQLCPDCGEMCPGWGVYLCPFCHDTGETLEGQPCPVGCCHDPHA